MNRAVGVGAGGEPKGPAQIRALPARGTAESEAPGAPRAPAAPSSRRSKGDDCEEKAADHERQPSPDSPPDKRIEFRVGIHLGDVVEKNDDDLMGDGVNIAARSSRASSRFLEDSRPRECTRSPTETEIFGLWRRRRPPVSGRKIPFPWRVA